MTFMDAQHDEFKNWIKLPIPSHLAFVGVDERVAWREENLNKSEWTCYDNTYYFMNEADALVFKLKFGL